MKTIAFIGGPKHGHTIRLEDHHAQIELAIPKDLFLANPSFDPSQADFEAPCFDRYRYTRRTLGLHNTKRRMDYLVLSSLSDDQALRLVDQFEGAGEETSPFRR